MKPIVFIHTNDKQMTGAKVSEYSLKTRSAHPDKFDVQIIHLEETPHLYKREGQEYLRKGKKAIWHNDDLQSFSPLRRMVPQVMEFEGRALVIDPDVFAVGDVYDLLSRDMKGKSIICKHEKGGYRGNGEEFYASSVMLLDCKKLKHWKWNEQIDELFAMKLDYGPWISLLTELEGSIGKLEEEWNHFDQLNDKTMLIHNTERSTQPWKTGLPVDYDSTWRKKKIAQRKEAHNSGLFSKLIHCWLNYDSEADYYLPHPDPNQERFFMGLLKEAMAAGVVAEAFVHDEIKKKHVRADILKVVNKLAA